MDNDVLNIVNIDKLIGMQYPPKGSQMAFTVSVTGIETTPNLYKIWVEYGVEHYKPATILVNRVRSSKTVELGYDVELVIQNYSGFPDVYKTVYNMKELSSPTIFLSGIKKFIEREIDNLPF